MVTAYSRDDLADNGPNTKAVKIMFVPEVNWYSILFLPQEITTLQVPNDILLWIPFHWSHVYF